MTFNELLYALEGSSQMSYKFSILTDSLDSVLDRFTREIMKGFNSNKRLTTRLGGSAHGAVTKTIMVYSHWLGLEPGPWQEPGLVLCGTFHIVWGPGRMGCVVLIRIFHTAPGQEWRTLVFITGHIFRTWKMGTRPICQVLKMFQVFFLVPVQVQCERFLLKPYNLFQSLSRSWFQTKPVWIHHNRWIDQISISYSPVINASRVSSFKTCFV